MIIGGLPCAWLARRAMHRSSSWSSEALQDHGPRKHRVDDAVGITMVAACIPVLSTVKPRLEFLPMKQSHKLGRRMVLGGAAGAGGLVAAASLLPSTASVAVDAAKVGEAKPEPAASGYQLSEHVKRYYATARI
jgi:hypothetical protein